MQQKYVYSQCVKDDREFAMQNVIRHVFKYHTRKVETRKDSS
jgi:hypothetical protein